MKLHSLLSNLEFDKTWYLSYFWKSVKKIHLIVHPEERTNINPETLVSYQDDTG
jgi:hypothetical protein